MHLAGRSTWRRPGGWFLDVAAQARAGGQRRLRVLDSIGVRLIVLALVSPLPLLVLTFVNAAQDLADARTGAQAEAMRVAQLQADLLDEHVRGVDTLLRAVATNVSATAHDAAGSETLLRGILAELPPMYTDLFLEPPDAQADAPSGLLLGIGGTSPTYGVVLGRPVLGRDGRPLGVVRATSRLDRLPRLETRDVPAGSTMMVLDQNGVVLARSPDYDVWVGRDLGDQPYVQRALRRRQGTDEMVGTDGVSRLSAYTTASRAPWLVYVGLPSEIVLGSSRVALLRNMWFGLLALGAAVVLAWLLAGRITAPIRRLAADAAALGRGELGRRTTAERRDEVGVLAAVFNQMAEDVERHVGELEVSHGREQEARLAAEEATRQIAVREQRLQDLVRRLQVAQEEERRRVAYEIHDGLAQVAASAHQHLQTFADVHAPESASGRAALERTVELVQRTVREARRLIAGLRPTVLDDFGLATAIRLEVEALASEGWQVSYDERLGDRRLPSTIETALYRVAQEALTNVRKHAGRARVAVTLEQRGSVVHLQVRDWGRGFVATAVHDRPRPGERVGLLGMQERVALLHGHCAVTSGGPGAGTQVQVEVPLAQPSPVGADHGG